MVAFRGGRCEFPGFPMALVLGVLDSVAFAHAPLALDMDEYKYLPIYTKVSVLSLGFVFEGPRTSIASLLSFSLFFFHKSLSQDFPHPFLTFQTSVFSIAPKMSSFVTFKLGPNAGECITISRSKLIAGSSFFEKALSTPWITNGSPESALSFDLVLVAGIDDFWSLQREVSSPHQFFFHISNLVS